MTCREGKRGIFSYHELLQIAFILVQPGDIGGILYRLLKLQGRPSLQCGSCDGTASVSLTDLFRHIGEGGSVIEVDFSVGDCFAVNIGTNGDQKNGGQGKNTEQTNDKQNINDMSFFLFSHELSFLAIIVTFGRILEPTGW